VRIDPQLEEELNKAEADSAQQIGVWATVGTKEGRPTLAPAEVTDLARAMIERAESRSGHRAAAVKVHENLNTFTLDAPAKLIRELAQEPQVLQLRSVRRGESMAIKPEPSPPSDVVAVRRRRRR